MMDREQINIVIVGHVDHGKSTVIGRLLADTGSLPDGKLDDVKALCARNAKPFEYAFLLDALKDERSQGITIDSARCFFKTKKRDYIVIDAPGHIEFLKNMVTGAARAEAALLVIAADEGIQENSKRHGYLVSMLGIRQVVVILNKMDIVGYDRKVYDALCEEYTAFLETLHVKPIAFIPISARDGENLVAPSSHMSWYKGPSVLAQLDAFEKKSSEAHLPLRFPVQDIYKFTEANDDRRIIAGTIETGSLQTGDEIVLLPSQKRSRIQTIESFNTQVKTRASAGDAIGITLDTQLYIKPGEIITRSGDQQPQVSSRFRAHIFWMGRSPLILDKTYKLKLATCRAPVRVAEITHVLDATDLSMTHSKKQLNRHDVGEVILETTKPIAFDPVTVIEGTGRFVIVDHYEIAGGGIILQGIDSPDTLLTDHIREREIAWDKGFITQADRYQHYGHRAKFIVIAGEEFERVTLLAKELEHKLFINNHQTYYLGFNNLLSGIAADTKEPKAAADDAINRLGELARILTDAGQIFITALSGIDDYDLEILKMLNTPAEILVVCVGNNVFSNFQVDLVIEAEAETDSAVREINELLREKEIVAEYFI
ncbi:MAG: 50S ribosome-binding GTPase [Deltaproteobacteria bacterium]